MAGATTSALPPLARPRADWRLLFRALGAASDPRALILAALGAGALLAGWTGLALVFGAAPWTSFADGHVVSARTGIVFTVEGAGDLLLAIAAPVLSLLAPFAALFRPDVSLLFRLHAGLASLWGLIVWSLFGGAIARLAAVRIARSGRIGVLGALQFSFARFGTSIAAPLAPLGVAFGLGLLGAAVGLLNRIPGSIGQSAAVFLAVVPLAVGLLDAVILLGLALAWPLMAATVAVDGEDFFDVVSRSYSYVNQRAARYAGLLAGAFAIGAIGLIAFSFFFGSALSLADWSIGLGAPRGVGFRFGRDQMPETQALPVLVPAFLWHGLLEMIATGWTFAYFWSASTVIYLILRQDVDGAELHDIHQLADEAEGLVPAGPTEESPLNEGSSGP